MIMLITALLLETNVVVDDVESLKIEKVYANSGELNWIGRESFLITAGGSLYPLWSSN